MHIETGNIAWRNFSTGDWAGIKHHNAEVRNRAKEHARGEKLEEKLNKLESAGGTGGTFTVTYEGKVHGHNEFEVTYTSKSGKKESEEISDHNGLLRNAAGLEEIKDELTTLANQPSAQEELQTNPISIGNPIQTENFGFTGGGGNIEDLVGPPITPQTQTNTTQVNTNINTNTNTSGGVSGGGLGQE